MSHDPNQLKNLNDTRKKLSDIRDDVARLLAEVAEGEAECKQLARTLPENDQKLINAKANLDKRVNQLRANREKERKIRFTIAKILTNWMDEKPEEDIKTISAEFPIVLFPIRIETRFTPVGKPKELKVRIYPDEILADTHEPGLTRTEIEDGKTYWNTAWNPDEDKNAWRSLISKFPSTRASWIVYKTRPRNIEMRPTIGPKFTEPFDVESTQPRPTNAEVEAGKTYWRSAWNPALAGDAWNSLITHYPDSKRAEKIIQVTTPTNIRNFPRFPPKFGEISEIRPQSWTRPAEARLLPDRWIVLAYRNGKEVHRVIGSPIVELLALTINPTADIGNNEEISAEKMLLDPDVGWTFDFDRAEQVGMAVRIKLLPEDIKYGFDRLLVLGVKASLDPQECSEKLKDLLDAHHYTRGFAFVPQGTPTNNTTSSPSGFPPDDPNGENSFKVEREGLFTNGKIDEVSDGYLFMRALGVSTDFANHIAGANRNEQQAARAMNNALWPVTLGYYIEQMLAPGYYHQSNKPKIEWLMKPEMIKEARNYFVEHVRGRGPYPAFRVGDTPYGLLPVTSLNRWSLKTLEGHLANPAPDLVVFHIDNPGGMNYGYYRIGWGMDKNGNIRESWSNLYSVSGPFGEENQGADIAIADINNDGQLDLIIFYIDNQAGENKGYYRIGWNLNADGKVMNDWSGPKEVPGWFGAENQGAGIAVVDLNNDGRPELIVFHIDNPGGGNKGYYRIGWNLDIEGNVTDGWSSPVEVPGWFGDETQGAGIAIGDINDDGQPELIVLHIDNPGGGNRGYYRIGWNMDSKGKVAQWSDRIPIPGWFGDETHEAGIAIADLNGDNRPELLVFHIDNPGGENCGYYRVGWKLDVKGMVSHWSEPIAVPVGWLGEENQGAGIALADINNNGRPDLLAFVILNPSGENVGYYRISWDLDVNGNVASYWTIPKLIPGKFGLENQGGGVAIADLDKDDQLELIIMHIENISSENRGYYRIGRRLLPDGSISGGWSEPILIPGGFGEETLGTGIAVADLDNNKQPEMIVFHIDNMANQDGNEGYYRIGWGLDENERVNNGTELRAIPLRRSSPPLVVSNIQGTCIAIGNIDNDPSNRPDLIVFYFENDGGENKGYYRIGWNIDSSGKVSGWSDPIAVPVSFGNSIQGSGLAIVDIPGVGKSFVVFYIDNPAGENKGYYRIGWELNTNGEVTGGWSNPIEVPGWFGAENQDGGIAVANIRKDGWIGFLRSLLDLWKQSIPKVPHIGRSTDIDRDLLEILGMDASAREVRIRTVFGLNLLVNLYYYRGTSFFGIDWKKWHANQKKILNDILRLLGYPAWDESSDEANCNPRIGEMIFDENAYLFKYPFVTEDPLSEKDSLPTFTVYHNLSDKESKNYTYIKWIKVPPELEDAELWSKHERFAHEGVPLKLPTFNFIGKNYENYIRWITEVPPVKFGDFLDDLWSEHEGAPLLFLMLRHAMLLEYTNAAFEMYLKYDLIGRQEKGPRREPELIVDPVRGKLEKYTAWNLLNNKFTETNNTEVYKYLWENKDKETVTDSQKELKNYYQSVEMLVKIPTAELDRLFTETLDVCSHRIDAWITSLASKRLKDMRDEQAEKKKTGNYLGAFGWVENLRPAPASRYNWETLNGNDVMVQNRSGGYTHAPSMTHASTAALLRNAYLTRAGDERKRYAIDLSSQRVRKARWLLDAVREGQPLGAVLGYYFERKLHELELEKYIDQLREKFPLVEVKEKETTDPAETISARNVVDGLALLKALQNNENPFDGLQGITIDEKKLLNEEAKVLIDMLDAVADLLTAESVYQVIRGNAATSAVSLDAMAQGLRPPDPEVARAPRGGTSLTHRVALILDKSQTVSSEWPATPTPRALVEPCLDAWIGSLLDKPNNVKCRVSYLKPEPDDPLHIEDLGVVTLADLGLRPIDILFLAQGTQIAAQASEIDQRIAYAALIKSNKPEIASQVIRINYTPHPDWNSNEIRTFPEILELARTINEIIGGARQLRPDDLLPPESAAKANESVWNISEPSYGAEPRAISALSKLENAKKELDDRIAELEHLFIVSEFKPPLTIDSFCAVIKADNYGISLVTTDNTIDRLNELLTVPNLFEILREKKPNVDFSKDIMDLVDKTKDYKDKNFSDLNNEEKNNRKTLNRFLLEESYPLETPLKKITVPNLSPIRLALLSAAQFGITGAIPGSAKDPDTSTGTPDDQKLAKQILSERMTVLIAQAKKVQAELQQRFDKAKPIKERLDASVADDKTKLQESTELVKTIFGREFNFIVGFKPVEVVSGELTRALTIGPLLPDMGKKADIILKWFQGAARVRPPLERLHKLSLYTGVLGTKREQFDVVQLPFKEGEQWVALPFDSEGKRPPSGRVSLAIYGSVKPEANTIWTGLLIDEWNELIPNRDELTGITFHYDDPGAEAPQTVLVAVPPYIGGSWDLDTLIDIINETLDLAKIRAVDSELIGTIGQVLPAIILADNTANPKDTVSTDFTRMRIDEPKIV